MRTLKIASCAIIIILFAVSSCKKFVEIDPPDDQVISNTVFTNDNIALSAITGVYAEMMNGLNQFSCGKTTFYTGLTSDELYNYFLTSEEEFSKNEITISGQGTISLLFWQPCYKYIYASNLAIEKLGSSTSLSPAVKDMLTGESKFVRAFCYFYLVNLFGDVPLITSSNYEVNQNKPRAPVSEIYDLIINDLKDAQSLLLPSYPTGEKVRPNKWVATALLARVYLYLKNWSGAEEQSSAIINSGNFSLEPGLNNVFLKNSTEAIWQLMPVRPNFNTYEGNAFIPPSAASSPSYLLTPAFVNSYESGDQRRLAWVGTRVYAGDTVYYPTKYKVFNGSNLTEYYMVFRLAEQYLIRAEARAQQDDITGATNDVDTIRFRAGLSPTTATDKSSMLEAIEKERKIELGVEWGHRWFDLKRTGRADAVLGPVKESTWQSTDTLWPIPKDQLLLNSALTQNQGYDY